MSAFEALAVLDTSVPETVDAALVGPGDEPCDVMLTGIDGLMWFAAAANAEDLVFAVWNDPGEPLTVFTDDAEKTESLLASGTILVLAGEAEFSNRDAAPIAVRAPDAFQTFFGVPVLMSPEPASEALRRMCGEPDAAWEALSSLGVTATILARQGTQIAGMVRGHAPTSLVTADDVAGRVAARSAWTRGLGAIRLRHGVPDVAALVDDLGPVGSLTTGSSAVDRTQRLLAGPSDAFDLIATARPGGVTTWVSDVATAFGGLGVVALTGSAVPARPVIAVSGAAAELVRDAGSPAESVRQQVVLSAGAAEDRDRFEAHQWASAQRRAVDVTEDDYPSGGLTLAAEAAAVGYPGVFVSGDGIVDFDLLEAVGVARDWREIDPALPGVLDPVLAHVHLQIAGSDDPVPLEAMQRLSDRAQQPAFWESVLSSTEPVDSDRIVFPYPAPAVDLLRTAVAAAGDAVELRHLLGPVKVAVLRELGGIA